MADVGATVQAFADAGSAAQQGDWDAAAAAAAPAIEAGIDQAVKTTKPPKGQKPSAGHCAAAAAQGAVGGAGAGAAVGSAILPGLGTLIGAGIGALGGGLAAAGSAGCLDGQPVDWKAEVREMYAEAPFVRVLDVNGVQLRKQVPGSKWTAGPNAAETFLSRFPIGQKGLTVGRLMHLMRRARELGGGADELARIVGLVAPKPSVQVSDKQERELFASKAYKGAVNTAEQLGNTEAGKLLRNQLRNERIAALMRGGFNRFDAEKRVLGKPLGASFPGIIALRQLISAAEPTASYVGPLRDIFGRPRAALPASTRAADADVDEPSAAVPLALGAAAVGAFFLLRK